MDISLKTHLTANDFIEVGACLSGIIEWGEENGLCLDAELPLSVFNLADDYEREWVERALGVIGDNEHTGSETGIGFGQGIAYGIASSTGDGGGEGRICEYPNGDGEAYGVTLVGGNGYGTGDAYGKSYSYGHCGAFNYGSSA
jgi:hypothetical protein